MISRTPTYNLKAVQKETGLTADVLRAWERRYKLPQPHRTAGGHRLYSEYDIQILKWLHARQVEGLSISHAVELWKETIEAGQDPLAKYPLASPPAQHIPTQDTRTEILRQQWLDATLAFDSLNADEVLNQAFAIYPIETVCTEILQQGISEIGALWLLDEASVQQEHFATAQAYRRLETLISATPQPIRRQTILLGCPPGEQHTFSLLLLNLFLRRQGLKVVYLGADIPTDQMSETTRTIQPDLIVLAAQQLSTAATLRSALLTLRGLGIPLAFGGLIFNRVPDLRQHIPAHFLGNTLDAAVQMIERLLVTSMPFPSTSNVDTTYQELSRLYQQRRTLIEKTLLETLPKDGFPTEYLAQANSYFGSALSAVLEFGNLTFLEPDLDWVKRLLTGRHIQSERLTPYLLTYSQAIDKELGKAGMPITAWIGHYVMQNGSTYPDQF
jgi:DNA-binding transcriptional MerR regulator